MRVDLLLAESALSVDGLLFVQAAGWNRFIASSLPRRVGRLSVAILVHVPPAEAEAEHTLDLRLVDPRGHVVSLPLAGDTGARVVERIAVTFRPDGPAPLHAPLLAPLAVDLDGLMLEAEGLHHFVVAIDGADTCEVEFDVSVRGKDRQTTG